MSTESTYMLKSILPIEQDPTRGYVSNGALHTGIKIDHFH